MPDVRFVCLSDTHFGASNSLLTNLKSDGSEVDPTEPSPVLVQLIACLRDLISKNANSQPPVLILNGDILELALTTDNIAAMAFERFLELIMPNNGQALFNGTINYIPGNHDHHLWETARETQYVDFISQTKLGKHLEIPWHATKMFAPDPVPSCFLNGLIRRHAYLGNTTKVGTIYPNLALLGDSTQECVIFSHGHFTESMYLLMSDLRTLLFPNRQTPRATWDYEAENFAWIDFFWSTMGRSGDVWTDVELIYDKLQDQRQLESLVLNLITGLIKRFGSSVIPDWVQSRLLRPIVRGLLIWFSKRESAAPDRDLTVEGEKGLRNYLEGPLREQVLEERHHNMPTNVTFVFGHTHKPFQRDIQFNGYSQWTKVYNSGGWVVDTVVAEPLHGGAIILVDENLNTTSLRMYNEQIDGQDYSVKVESATHAGAATNPFHDRIKSLVDPTKDPWKGFSETVAGSRPAYVTNLQNKISRKN